MNCQEALSLLYEIIDKEASEIDEKQVRDHLEKCNECFEVYRLEGAVNQFLSEKLRNGNTEHAQEKLKSRILGQLDGIDSEAPDSETPHGGPDPSNKEGSRPFRFPAIVLVAAASVVILLGAAFLGSQFYQHQQHFIPLEQSHWTVADLPINSLNNGQQAALINSAATKFHYDLKPAVDNFRLIGGKTEQLLGTEMLHYVYADNGSRVSVFLAPGPWFDQFEGDEMEQVVRNNIQFFDHNCRGCRLVFHRRGDVAIITASADREVELLEFVPGHSRL